MNPEWTVKKVVPLREYKILLTFENDIQKVFDVKPYLEFPMYSQLKDISFFNTVHTNGQTAVWNEDIDIAPEHLCECSKPIAN